jgi:DNA-directed RNA polymerase subunit RPC12/RpoP
MADAPRWYVCPSCGKQFAVAAVRPPLAIGPATVTDCPYCGAVLAGEPPVPDADDVARGLEWHRANT